MTAETKKSHCNDCGGERTHHVLYRDSSGWDNEEASISGGTTHEMLKCAGCEKVVLREQEWCSEDWPGHERDPRFYPPATFRPVPKWITDSELTKEKLRELMKEVYIALQNNQPYLAAMGIRAALEYIMIDKVKDNGPSGHFKFLHPWPGQIPPGPTAGMIRLLLGIVAFCKAADGLFQTIAFAFELDEHATVH